MLMIYRHLLWLECDKSFSRQLFRNEWERERERQFSEIISIFIVFSHSSIVNGKFISAMMINFEIVDKILFDMILCRLLFYPSIFCVHLYNECKWRPWRGHQRPLPFHPWDRFFFFLTQIPSYIEREIIVFLW